MKQRVMDYTVVTEWDPGDFETVETAAVFYRTGQTVRLNAVEGIPGINANDVAEVLGVDLPPADGDGGPVDANGRPERNLELSEVYRLAGRSSQPWARNFADWVARRVVDLVGVQWASGPAAYDPAIRAATTMLEAAWQMFYDVLARQAEEPLAK